MSKWVAEHIVMPVMASVVDMIITARLCLDPAIAPIDFRWFYADGTTMTYADGTEITYA